MNSSARDTLGHHFAVVATLAVCVLATLASAAEAQPFEYNREELIQPYAPVEGSGIAQLVVGNEFNGALQVELPFAFPFFEREYRHAWLSTNGSVLFLDHQLEGNVLGVLEPTEIEQSLRGAIHAVRSDLVAGPYRKGAFTAHVVDGGSRVVFQWRRVAFAQGERLTELNFQVHLYQSGRIRLWYGPEWAIVADVQPFVSGIVNHDGTVAVAGFGDTLTTQFTRPSSNRVIDLVPIDTPQVPDAINLVSTSKSAEPVVLAQGGGDVVVASFEAHASGAGGSFDEIEVTHPPFPVGSAVQLMLVADEGQVGVFDPSSDTVLATETLAPGSFSTEFEFADQQVGGATPFRRYLLVASISSLPSIVYGSFVISASDGDVDATVPVYGGVHTAERKFSPGPVVNAYHSTLPERRVARAGDTNVLLASIQLRRHEALGPTTLNDLQVELIYSAMSDADIDAVRLFRDDNATGTLDPQAQPLAVATVSGTSATFTNLAHTVPPNSESGLALLITADISSDFTATGFVGFDQATSSWSYSNGNTVTQVHGQPTTVRVLGGDSYMLLQRNETHALTHLPVLPGQTGLAAMSFTAQTSVGGTQIQSLRFAGNTDGVQSARLFYDNGQHQGRWDAGDTLIEYGDVGANVLEFTNLQTLSISDSPIALLLVVDLAPTVAPGTRQFTLTAADVSVSNNFVVAVDSTATGPPPAVLEGVELAIGEAAPAPGVDVAVSFVRDAVDFGAEQIVPLAVVSVLPRNGGGEAPSIVFSLVDSRGGVTDNVISLIPFLDATASGTLSDGDPDLIGLSAPLNILSIVPLGQGVAPTVVSQTRVFLIGIRREFEVTGTCQIVFRGVTGGTNPQIVGWPSTQRVVVGVGDDAVAQPRGGGGCATGMPVLLNVLPLLPLLLTLLALRRRRCVASRCGIA